MRTSQRRFVCNVEANDARVPTQGKSNVIEHDRTGEDKVIFGLSIVKSLGANCKQASWLRLLQSYFVEVEAASFLPRGFT